MHSMASRLLFVLLQVVLVTKLIDATGDARPTLVVRTYGASGISEAGWQATVRSAATILGRAGIRVEWVHCSAFRAGEPDSGPSRCTMPYERNEVALRLASRPTMGPRDQVLLGDSLIDASMHSGTLATIYLEHVERLAAQAHVGTGTVMARAMAHELGHLVLGTNTHSNHGLMRPVWTPEEVSRDRASDWRIPPDDGERMRQVLRRRIESPVLTRMIDGCPVSDSSARSDSCSKPTS
jgi:hypothetical protein